MLHAERLQSDRHHQQQKELFEPGGSSAASSSSSSSSASSSFDLLIPKWEPVDSLLDLDLNEEAGGCSANNSQFKPFPWALAEQDSGVESAEGSQRHSDNECGGPASPEDEGKKTMALLKTAIAEETGDKSKDQRCAVCGDAATGFHYNVSSCNGCKTFFRRTIMTGRKFVCKLGGNCKFDRNGRCACRACRFRRCVEVGMNEAAIQHTPSANLTLSIARRRFHRFKGRGKATALAVPTELVRGFEHELLALIGQTLRLEERMNRLRHSSFSPVDLQMRIDRAVETRSAFADSDKYPLVQKWPPRPSSCPGEVSEMIRMGIKFWLYTDLYLGMEYLKTLPPFAGLKREEKIALTKSVVVPNQLLSAALFSAHIHSDIVQYPDGCIPFQEKLSSPEQILPLERKILRGAISAVESLRPDQVQTALIRAILLLDSNCDGLSPEAKDQIEQLRSRMCRALLIYLQNRHGPEMGLRQFSESLNFIATLFQRQQVNKNYFVYRHYVMRNSVKIPLFWDFMDERSPSSSSTLTETPPIDV